MSVGVKPTVYIYSDSVSGIGVVAGAWWKSEKKSWKEMSSAVRMWMKVSMRMLWPFSYLP